MKTTSTVGEEHSTGSGDADSDNPDTSYPDIPLYQILHEAPLESTQPSSPQPGPSGTQQEPPEARQGGPSEKNPGAPATPKSPAQWALIMGAARAAKANRERTEETGHPNQQAPPTRQQTPQC